MTRDQAIARVKKLLALHQDAHATEAERDTALRLAQRLVDEFLILEHEVVPTVEAAPEPEPTVTRMTPPLDPDLREVAEQIASQILAGATGRVFSAVMEINSEERRKQWVDKFMKGLFKD